MFWTGRSTIYERQVVSVWFLHGSLSLGVCSSPSEYCTLFCCHLLVQNLYLCTEKIAVGFNEAFFILHPQLTLIKYTENTFITGMFNVQKQIPFWLPVSKLSTKWDFTAPLPPLPLQLPHPYTPHIHPKFKSNNQYVQKLMFFSLSVTK